MPVPPIQSPEVERKIKVGFAYGHTKDKFEYVIKDTTGVVVDEGRFIPGIFGVKLEMNVGERISFNTAVIPLLLINYWDAGIKYQIVKYDHHQIPSNVALSLFMHTNGLMNVAFSGSSSNASFGILTGKKMLPNLEIICMPSISFCEQGKAFEGYSTIAQYDTIAKYGLHTNYTRTVASLGLGFIYEPENTYGNGIGFSGGLYLRHMLKQEIDESQFLKVLHNDFYPVYLYCGMYMVFSRGEN